MIVVKIFEVKKGIKMIKYIFFIFEINVWYREFKFLENVLFDINKGFIESVCMFGEIWLDYILDDFIILKFGISIYIWYVGYCVMKVIFLKIKESEVIVNKVVKLVDLFLLFLVGICVIKDGRFFVFVIDIIVFSEDIYISS